MLMRNEWKKNFGQFQLVLLMLLNSSLTLLLFLFLLLRFFICSY